MSDAPTDGVGEVLGGVVPWVISGRSVEGLRGQAARLAEFAGRERDLGLADIGFSLVSARSTFEQRAVVLGSGRQKLLGGLDALAVGESAADLVVGEAGSGAVAFLFTGQGAQRLGMGKESYEAFPVFRAAFDEVCAGLDEILGVSVKDVVFAAGEGAESTEAAEGLLEQTMFAQAGLFALEVALFRLVEAWGVHPGFLMGHSIGELAAAHVAGVFSLEDACRLVAARGRLMGALPAGGAMVSVWATQEEALESLQGREGKVSLAAVNGPSSVVFSGDEDAVLALAEEWRARGRKTKRLRVSHAFHSSHMDGMLDEFARVAESIEFHPPRIPLVSNLTGEVAAAEDLCSAGYWVRHVREAVRFADGVRWLTAHGVSRFLELGPDGVLSAMAHGCMSDEDALVAVAALRGERSEARALLGALAELWVCGVGVDWGVVFGGCGGVRVGLPFYAFQRERFLACWWWGCGIWLLLGRCRRGIRCWVLWWVWLVVVGCLRGVWVWIRIRGLVILRCWGLCCCRVRRLLSLCCVLVVRWVVGCWLSLCCGCRWCWGVWVCSCRWWLMRLMRLGGGVGLGVYSREVGGEEGVWVCHASGTLAPEEESVQEQAAMLAGEAWPPADCEPVAVEDLYDRLAELGYEYGPVFQGVEAAWRRGEEVFVEVSLSEDQRAQAASFGLHPALLDAAFHTAALGLLEDGVNGESHAGASGGARLPFSWNGVRLHATGASSLRIRLSPAGEDGLSLVAGDESGTLVASVDALLSRQVAVEQLGGVRAGGHESLFALEWVSAGSGAEPEPSRSTAENALQRCAVLGGDSTWLAAGLHNAEIEVEAFTDLGSLRGTLDEGSEAPAVVFVDCTADALGGTREAALADAAVDAGTAAGALAQATVDAGTVVEAAHLATRHALGLLRAWLFDERLSASRLVLVTRGAVAVGSRESVPGLADAPIWGLVRSAQSEYPGRFVLLDLAEADTDWRALIAGLASDEPQLAMRQGELLAPRLARAGAAATLTAPAEESAWRLGITEAGTLENLALLSCPQVHEPLVAGQVRVGMRAGGLNFRDVLIALGMYPGEGTMGGEGAGVVLEVGPEVEHLRIGDRVMGLFAGAFGPVAVTDHRLIVQMPEEWSFTTAAAIPAVFLTAYHALVDLAGLQAGERLLVHAAAGGVGMAATQLAQYLDAEVFATASSATWGSLTSQGLDAAHIASSRSPEFAEQFLKATSGEGVDVVLSSLAGELVDASLALLHRGGRFIEIGKADIRDAAEVANAHPGVLYQAFDLLLSAGPDRVQEILVELVGLFERGALRPLPVTTWDVRRAEDAFRFMSQARHVGKNVLTVPSSIDPRGTILITGGTGDLGALLARHLVSEHGAGHLLLLSRRGREAPGAPELEAELVQMGATVTIAACDVTDRSELHALIGALPQEHPLNAVVHAAGVIDDAVIGSLTEEQIDRVLAPKVDAAWHLHELTRHLDLAAFVLFSSAAGAFGGPGQANYAAATVFLDVARCSPPRAEACLAPRSPGASGPRPGV